MPTLDSTAVAVLDDQQGLAELPDFTTDAYKDAYSRINAIVIEGEQEAHDNYISLGTLIPDQAEELAKLREDGNEAHEGLHRLCQKPGRCG